MIGNCLSAVAHRAVEVSIKLKFPPVFLLIAV